MKTSFKEKIIFSLLMAFFMSMIMSGAMTMLHVGFNIYAWFKSWKIAFCVALPVTLIIGPICRKITMKIVDLTTPKN